MFSVYDVWTYLVMSFLMLAESYVVLQSLKCLKIELQNFSFSTACSVFTQNDPAVVLPSLYRDFAWEVVVAVSLVLGRDHCCKVLWSIFLIHTAVSLLSPHPHQKYFYVPCGSEVAYQFDTLFFFSAGVICSCASLWFSSLPWLLTSDSLLQQQFWYTYYFVMSSCRCLFWISMTILFTGIFCWCMYSIPWEYRNTLIW